MAPAAAKRICLIGDLHLGAVSNGWKTIAAEFPHIEANFFASPGRSMQHVAVKDGELVPGTEELAYHFQRTARLSAIDGAYDLYTVYGLHCSLLTCPDIWSAYRRASAAGDASHAAPEVIAETIAGRVLPRVRQITVNPVALIATPMIGEGRCEKAWEDLRRTGADAALAGFFTRSCRAFAESVGARFLPQPAETLASPLHTLNAYATEQARFSASGDTRPADGKHMNAAFGAIVMRQLLGEFLA